MSASRMLWLGLAAWSGVAAGCAAPPAAHSPTAAIAPSKAAPRSQFCAEGRLTAHGQSCVGPVTEAEQTEREFSVRLEYQGDLVTHLVRVNGRGSPVPNDSGCVEYRYTFDGGYLTGSVGYRLDGTICDRNSYAQRATRVAYFDEFGRVELSSEHDYVGMTLEHDAGGFIVGERAWAADGSAGHFLMAEQMKFERDAQHFETRSCYFDAQGKPQRSSAGVHCWSYEHDRFGNDLREQAWDEQGKPAATFDGVHEIRRVFDLAGNLVRKTNLNLQGLPIDPLPRLCPVVVFLRDDHGTMIGAECQDGQGNPTRFENGNSSWRGTPDGHGWINETRYFDTEGNAYAPEFGYARVEVARDDFGNATERHYFRTDGRPGQERGVPVIKYIYDAKHLEVRRQNFDERGDALSYKGCVATESEYDAKRQLVRQACRGFTDELTLSSDNVATTFSTYDARGLVSETRFTDAKGQPIDSDDGYARAVHAYDARGQELRTRHYKADGSEVTLKRFSALWVRPAHADRFWPGLPRERAEARIQEARGAIAGGLPLELAVYRYGDVRIRPNRPGDAGYLNLAQVFPILRQALEPLAVGAYSNVVELPFGFVFYQRTE